MYQMSGRSVTPDGTGATVNRAAELMVAPLPTSTLKWSPDPVVNPTAVTPVKLVPVITRLGTAVPVGVLPTESAVRSEVLVGELKGVSGMTGGVECPLLSVESTWR